MKSRLLLYVPLLLLLQPKTGVAASSPVSVTNETMPVMTVLTNTDDEAFQYLQLFAEALVYVKKQYVAEKGYPEIINGAIHGMIESLDPHSHYMEPEILSRMKEATSGEYGGIGIYIGMRDEVLTVISPIEDTPAFKAGIHAGDRIIKIDDEETSTIPFEDAVKRLRGAPGTTVVLTIFRPDDTEQGTRTFTLERSVIEVPSIKGTRILKNGVGYIRITQFAVPTSTEFRKAVDTLREQGMKALILDLRNNPGGLLQSATDVASLLLPRRALIVSTKGRPGVSEEVKNISTAPVHYTDFRVAVLINGGSASGSEIVAGALRDHKRAVLIGEKSYGKGSVQSVIQFREGPEAEEPAGMRLTTALYYTPSGEQIHEKGIMPDIEVLISPEEWRRALTRRAHEENPESFDAEEKAKYADAVDPQLERAMDILQALQVFR